MKSGDNKAGFESMLRRGLSSDSTPAAQDCPGPDVLAAYYERSLASAEIERFDAHFATCARCRAQIAALVRLESPEEKKLDARAAWLWHWRWLAPAIAAAAIVVIWAGIREHNKTTREPVSIAMNQLTTRPLEVAPPAPLPEALSAQTAVQTPPPPKPAPATGSVAGPHASTTGSADKLTEAQPVAPPRRVAPAEAPNLTRESAGGSAGGVVGGSTPEPPAPQDSTLSTTLAESAPVEETGTANRNATKLATPPSSGLGGATTKHQYALGAKKAPAAAPAKARSAVADQVRVLQALPKPIVIASPDATKSWRISETGAIEFSSDSGVSWETQKTASAGTLLSGFAPSAKVCWVVGRGGVVFRTANGTDWKQVATPTLQDLTGVTASNAKHAQVTAADASVFVTKDGGKSWSRQNNP
jgi:hypothetical protein